MDIAPDRKTAQARFRCIMMAGTHYEKNPNGPDEIANYIPYLWPDHEVMPFHCEHPVTGEPIITPEPGVKPQKD